MSVAERGWSDKETRDTDDAFARFHEWRCKVGELPKPKSPLELYSSRCDTQMNSEEHFAHNYVVADYIAWN
jgi:hypothetical protein